MVGDRPWTKPEQFEQFVGGANQGPHQLLTVVDVPQLTVQPDLHLLTRRTDVRRHRVQRLQTLNVVILMDRTVDRRFKLPAALMYSPTQLLLGQQCKLSLHQVQPGRAGWV